MFATLGDGIAAAFDAAGSAVDAAVAAQRDLAALGLAVRMGVHTGEVERAGGDYRGRPVNRAARIMAVGHGGQILVSDVTATLVRAGWRDDAVELVDVGPHRLRDLAEPERLWQVVHPDLQRSFPALAAGDAPRTALPTPRSSLVGRELDAQHVAALLRHERVVTLTGVGGVGKTRLALRVAGDLHDRFADVWYVGLSGITDPDDVVDAVALAVGAGGAAGSTLAAATAAVSGGPGLLVVDNCEHVIDAAAAVVDALATACPELRIVATSREALAVDGEQVVNVRPLPIATAAVELFRERAAAAGVALGDGHRSAIEALCARLDGLPLAIELAAARAATLGVAAIVDGLDDQALLRSGRRGATGRHGTMQATIEWSYRMLDPDEQRLFRRLGAFADGFELDAVQHVAASAYIAPPAATRHLESLVHKSMVDGRRARDGRALPAARDGARLRPRPARRPRRAPRGAAGDGRVGGDDRRARCRRSLQRRRRAGLDPPRAGGRQLARGGGRRRRRALGPAGRRAVRPAGRLLPPRPPRPRRRRGPAARHLRRAGPAPGGAQRADRHRIRRHRPEPAGRLRRRGGGDRRRPIRPGSVA